MALYHLCISVKWLKTQKVLIISIHLSTVLCDGNIGLVNANTQLICTEGSSVIVACHFTLSGRRKFLCKDECKEEDILIETEGDTAQSGRYSILYKTGTYFPVSSTVLYVSITQLTRSDSGRYRCGLERSFLPDSYWAFEIRVTEGKFPLRVFVSCVHSVNDVSFDLQINKAMLIVK